jgi:hypothetical protein
MITVSGCGSNKSDNETTQSSQNVESKSVKDIYASVSTMAEGKLTELDPQYLSNYYGIDTTDLDEYVFAQSDTPESSAETIIIIKSADTSKFDSYKTSFENYKKQKSQEKLRTFWLAVLFLFPTENLESDRVQNNHPDTDHADLWQ